MRQFLFTLLLVTYSTVSAAIIRFDGKEPFNAGDHNTRVSVLAEGSGLRVAADSLRTWLMHDGYLDAGVWLKADTIFASAGLLYRLRAVDITADSTYRITCDMPFSESALEDAVHAALKSYTSRGHYYARATVSGLARQSGSLTAKVNIVPGPIVTIGNVRFQGLSRTKGDVLTRLLPAVAGDTLTDELLAKLEQAASEITYVLYQSPVIVRPRFGYTQADIELYFIEKQQLLFLGGAGYSNEPGSGLVWDVAVEASNLFGEGREVIAQSERREKGRNVLDIAYSQPSTLLGQGLLRAAVSTRDYRDQFYEFAGTVGYEILLSRAFSAGVTLGLKRVEPTVGSGYSRADAIVSVTRSQVENRLNPSAGYVLSTSLGYSYRTPSADSTGAAKTYNDTRAQLSAGIYRSLPGHLVGYLGVNYRGLETGELLPPHSELFFVGGPGSIRGYRNEQFIVKRAALGTIEPRYRFASGYIFGFYDIAFTQQPVSVQSGVVTDESIHHGFGLGLAIADQLRSVKLSLGWNPDIAFDQPWLMVQFSTGL